MKGKHDWEPWNRIIRRGADRPAILMILALAGTLALGNPSHAHHFEDTPIQPGALFEFGNSGGCTLNLVFADETGTLHIGTAAHCAPRIGERVSMYGDIGEFGTVVYYAFNINDPSRPYQDFALIAIDEDKYEKVNPMVRSIGGPTAVARDPLAGTPTLHYGQGVIVSATEPSRSRAGVLEMVYDDASINPENGSAFEGWYLATHPMIGGDSGGPMLLLDGTALGVVSVLAPFWGEPGFLAGPTFARILDDLRDGGFDLDIVTAPFSLEPAIAPDAVSDRIGHCIHDPGPGSFESNACVRNPLPYPWDLHAHLMDERPSEADPVEDGQTIGSYYEIAWGAGAGSPLGSLGVTGTAVSSVPIRLPNDVAALTVQLTDYATEDVFFTLCANISNNPAGCGFDEDDVVAHGFNAVTIREAIPRGTWVGAYVYAAYVDGEGRTGTATSGLIEAILEAA